MRLSLNFPLKSLLEYNEPVLKLLPESQLEYKPLSTVIAGVCSGIRDRLDISH
jgi:hypothetical protein